MVLLVLSVAGCSCGGGPVAEVGGADDPLADTPVFSPGDGASPGAALNDPARVDAARATARAHGAAAVPELIRRLQGGAGNYSGTGYPALIELLGELGDTTAVPVLCAVLDDCGAQRYDAVRPWAIAALRRLGDPAALPALARVADDPSLPAAERVLAARARQALGAAPAAAVLPPPD